MCSVLVALQAEALETSECNNKVLWKVLQINAKRETRVSLLGTKAGFE